MSKKKATEHEILSLIGVLQHATKIVRSGRAFLSRMYATAAKLRELQFFTKLNRVQIRFVLVGHISGELEWPEPAAMHNYTASYKTQNGNGNDMETK